jgi:formylglycine-generating enzyme required for sulfatase activity/predicted Ser/Thr protein kinase
MSQWLWLLRRFRDGAATREELLSKLELLLEGGHGADALVLALHEENDRSPLPAGTLEAVEHRMKQTQEFTEGDKTQILDRRTDPTDLLVEGTDPVETWRMPVEVNSVLLGRFKLVQLIGEGGMSNVYKAIDLRKVEAGARDPHLAVKVLTVRFDDYFSSLSVMHQETSKLQTLMHPNIVRVIDFDRDGQTVFMTMEYLDGKSLKLRMPKNRAATQVPREEAVRIITSIASALDFAHRKHIVHGDLKPGNVIVSTSGEVKVIDFGIARFLRRPQEEGELTEDWERNFSALTPPYASPEMHDGAEPDARDDVYALASIAYELLAGEHPFSRIAANKAREACMAVPLSKRLRAHEQRALEHGLQFDRHKRTPTAQAFLDELNGKRQRTALQMAMWVGVAIVALAAAIFAGRTTKTSPAVGAPAVPLTEGTVFRDCPTCPLMRVLVPATFEQGSSSEGALPFERPARVVTIAYPLAAALNEVTVGEFSEFAKEYPRERSGCAIYDGNWRVHADVSWRNAVKQQNASYPVTCVSWQDASDYAAWLSLRTGETYRLPSASEWEYFAKAGSSTVPWDNVAKACEHANTADAAAVSRYPGWSAFGCNDNYVEAAPVGTYAANAFGLADTLGNAFEWVQDCWRDDYTNAPTDGSPVLEGNCGEREARGGSWFTTPEFVRAGYRNRFDAEYRSNSLGFRLVREIKKS